MRFRILAPGMLFAALLPAIVPAAARAAADTLRVPLGAGTSAFVALPRGKGPGPAVVVVHEWWGLNTQIRSMAHRLAELGYVAIVPDLYHGPVADDPETAHELSRGLPPERALADIAAAVAWLRSSPRAGKDSRLGIVGFCMGGRLSELGALNSDAFSACVMFYGPPETNAGALAKLRAPLLGHFGAEDRGIGHDQVEALRAGLKAAGKAAGEIYEYPGAGHGFMNETGRGFHKDAATLAWARTIAFFEKHLKRK